MSSNNLDSLLTRLQDLEESSDYLRISKALNSDHDSVTNSIFTKWKSNTELTNDESTYIDLLSALELSLVEYCTALFNTNANDETLIDSFRTCFFRKSQINLLTDAVCFVRDQNPSDIDEDDQMLIFLMRMLDARTLAYRLCFTRLQTKPDKLNEEIFDYRYDAQVKYYLRDMIASDNVQKKTKHPGLIHQRHRFFIGCCTFAIARYDTNANKLVNDKPYICSLVKYVRVILKKKDFDSNESTLYCLRGILALLSFCVPTDAWLRIINRALVNENDFEAQQENPFNIDLFSCIVKHLLGSDVLREKIDPAGTNLATQVLDMALVFLDKWCYTTRDTIYEDNETSASPSERNEVVPLLRSEVKIGAKFSEILLRYVHARYDRIRLLSFALLAIVVDCDDLKKSDDNNTETRELLKLIFDFIQLADCALPVRQYKGIKFERLLRYLHTFLAQDLVKRETLPYLSTIVDYARKRILYALMILRKLSSGNDMREQLLANTDFKTLLETDANDLFYGDPRMMKIVEQIRQDLAPPREEIEQPLPSTETHGRQIFISYCHDDKKRCEEIFDHLNKSKLLNKIWIDHNDIRDDMVDTITDGINQSQAVLVLLSDSYVNSDFCRREWTFARRKQRKVFPVVVQSDFKTTTYDWVSFFLMDDLYYRCDGKSDAKEKLIVDLREHYKKPMKTTEKPKLKGNTSTTDTPVKSVPNETTRTTDDPLNRSNYAKKSAVTTWTSHDIRSWCEDKNLDKWCDALTNFDGHALIELHQLLSTASHLELLVRDHQLTLFDVAQFKSALAKELSPAPTVTVVPRRFKKKTVRIRRSSKTSAK